MSMTQSDEITNAVEAKLTSDERLKDRAIEVSSQAGSLTLRGEVASEDEKAVAEELARSVDGVDVVINELVIRDEGEIGRDRGDPAVPIFVPGARVGGASGGYPYGGNQI